MEVTNLLNIHTRAELYQWYQENHDKVSDFWLRINRAEADCPGVVRYREVIEALIPGIPQSATVAPPFHCDHGHGIRLGENVFINYNGMMLDGGLITIGDNTQVGPNCQFLTPNHPIDYIERRKPIEKCSPITIGQDCWLGGGVTVCPGVTIGDRCIIGAGSVVTKDIPSDSMAVGNPCRVIKKLA